MTNLIHRESNCTWRKLLNATLKLVETTMSRRRSTKCETYFTLALFDLVLCRTEQLV